MTIQFFFVDTTITLSRRRELKLFIADLFLKKKRRLVSLSVIFCTDEYLLGINKSFLDHNYYTDVITFNLSEISNIIEGEIYISVDRVKENAGNAGCSLKDELHRVIFHGALHLCGLRDKTSGEKIEMTRNENLNLKRYFHKGL